MNGLQEYVYLSEKRSCKCIHTNPQVGFLHLRVCVLKTSLMHINVHDHALN